mgnify:CR=1 FL=1
MSRAPDWIPIASRTCAALLGGYVFSWGFTAVVVALNVAAGGDYWEGLTLAYLLAFLVYVVVFLWAFADARLLRVWLILAGGGAAMIGIAWFITPALPALS